MTVLALVLASFVLAQAASAPPTAGDPIPGVPNTADAAKPKHDTVKNSIGNTRSETQGTDPIPGVPPPPRPHAQPLACTPTAIKPCPPPDVPVKL